MSPVDHAAAVVTTFGSAVFVVLMNVAVLPGAEYWLVEHPVRHESGFGAVLRVQVELANADPANASIEAGTSEARTNLVFIWVTLP